MDNDEDENPDTIAAQLAERTSNYPADHDHHATQSFAVGWNLGRLQGRIIGQLLNDEELTVEDISDSLYHAELISYDSQQTFSITESVDDMLREITEEYDELDDVVDENQLMELAEEINEWTDSYISEIGETDSVNIVDKGLVDTRKLFREPESVFDDDVWDWLDEHPRQDLQDACQTLVLDMPTASSFLSLRAVEYCLRVWYEETTGDEIQATSWGRVTDKIESAIDDGQRPAVLSNLDYLREKRNGIAHPELSPSWEEAEDTLLTIRRTITEIHSEIA